MVIDVAVFLDLGGCRTGALETVIEKIAFALREYRNTEPADISLNQCMRSAVELIRSNQSFREIGIYNTRCLIPQGFRCRPGTLSRTADTRHATRTWRGGWWRNATIKDSHSGIRSTITGCRIAYRKHHVWNSPRDSCCKKWRVPASTNRIPSPFYRSHELDYLWLVSRRKSQ